MRRSLMVSLLVFGWSSLALASDTPAEHWSLRPRSHPSVPRLMEPQDQRWIRNPLDAFILERLKRDGLPPAPEADRITLIRRVSFDLIGLPPTPEEIAAFVQDPAPNAY